MTEENDGRFPDESDVLVRYPAPGMTADHAREEFDPRNIGYREHRPGSGVWYREGNDKSAFEPRACESCGSAFMGERKAGRGRFCSLSCANRRENRSSNYNAKHHHVRLVRGPAAEHACVDCRGIASNWSQIHGTDGLEPGHYEPRCRRCHAAYDTDSVPRGERAGGAKLIEAQVRDIRASVGVAIRDLAELYGVSDSQIQRIRNGENWKHVTGSEGAP